MKDFIALGFIVALIGGTSAAIANAHGHAVVMSGVGQSGALNVDTVNIGREAGGNADQSLYVALNDSGFGYDE
ncbi:hypothetical protein [Pseudomonas sp. KCJK9016]|uniref:hypothetical protein n=1 Tax=Pseudomonas sp. KCJK9016 TaxID=3344556 RepID=UPI003905A45B